MPRRAGPDRIEFTTGVTGEAQAALDQLVAAASGWANVFPEVDANEAEAVTPSMVASWFRVPGPPIPQATFIAPADGRRGRTPAQIGLTHGVGATVVHRLADEGLPLPAGWSVVQDHVRRGLILRLDDPPDTTAILAWCLKAIELLCPIPVTGSWLAEIHRG